MASSVVADRWDTEHSRAELVLRPGVTEESFGFGDYTYDQIRRLGPTWAPISKIRAWPGFPVTRFEELVTRAAHVAGGNRLYSLFFRGQSRDYLDANGRSTIYSSICRPPPGMRLLRTTRLDKRVRLLQRVMEAIRGDRVALDLTSRIHQHSESLLALVQHYELCPTPLLDVTRSLRVAASFALLNGTEGFVYVFGMPHPNGSISHLVDHETVIVHLQAVCPWKALRPHYQEGALIGRYPWNDAKERGDDVAHRMVAKFRLENSDGLFWGRGFAAIPRKALLPEPDAFGATLRDVVRPLLAAESRKTRSAVSATPSV